MVESVAHQHRKFWLVFSCLPLQLTHFEQSENLFYLLVSLLLLTLIPYTVNVKWRINNYIFNEVNVDSVRPQSTHFFFMYLLHQLSLFSASRMYFYSGHIMFAVQ